MKLSTIERITAKWQKEKERLEKEASLESKQSIEKILFISVAYKIGEFIKDLNKLSPQ